MIGCKLPWTKVHDNKKGKCSTTEHLNEYTKTLEKIKYFGEARYYNMTKCIAECTYYHYTTKQVQF